MPPIPAYDVTNLAYYGIELIISKLMMIHFVGVANDNCDIHNSVGMNMKHICSLKFSTLLNICNISNQLIFLFIF